MPGAEGFQIIGGALRQCGSSEDSPLVVLENFQPAFDIGSMILAYLRCDAKLGAEEGRADFGDQLFAGIPFIAPALTAKITVETGFMTRPMHHLMRKCGVVALAISEAFQRRHLHKIGTDIIIGLIAAVTDSCTGCFEEGFQCIIAANVGIRSLRFLVEAFQQAVDLLNVEDGVALHERNCLLDFPAILAGFGFAHHVGVDDHFAFRTFDDLATKLLRLFEGHPADGGEAVFNGCSPEKNDVETLVVLAIMTLRLDMRFAR